MNRDNLMRVLLVLLALAAGLWLVTSTEWVDIDVEKPPRGEAAKNRLYATQSLLRQLGVTVVKRQALDAMPPAGAHLVLVSRHWDLFPERGKRLRDWVEQGGHLVIPSHMVDHEQLREWLPVTELKLSPSAVAPASAPVRPGRGRGNRGAEHDCRELAEPDAVAARYEGSRKLRVCVPEYFVRFQPSRGRPPSWSLDGPRGSEMIRMPAGQGSVTVIGPWPLLENRNALRADNPLALAALLQARPGALMWFVAEETREPFLGWLWHHAWPAILLALLAAALFLWRGGVRFGPLAAIDPSHRRSMTEQVGGTAHFLLRHGPAALHGAQVRALHEAARRHLRGYGHLDLFKRAEAVAAASGLDAQALARALRPWAARRGGELAADIELLETARRRLDPSASPRAAASPSS